MGNEGSSRILEDQPLASVAKYIQSKDCKKIYLMLGAGVSTSAGIPDFRSPGTGLYANLARLKLPYPEAVFEIGFFRKNPIPFYTLARELMPGRFRPTITHSFVKVLADHGLLGMCFTQNIDTLERMAGVPKDLIVEAHGSFADQHCIDCHASYDTEKLKDQIKTGEIAKCKQCKGLVKPDIVFFGESLPPRFQKTVPLLRNADLLIVMGTSLTVHPFASLATMVPKSCPRVLINMDLVGNFGSRHDDVMALGKTDDMVRALCKELGWEKELEAAWKETENSVTELGGPPPATAESKVKKIADNIEQSLQDSDKKGEDDDVVREKGPTSYVEAENEEEGSKKVDEEVEKLASALETSLQVGGESSEAKTEPERVPDEKIAPTEEGEKTDGKL